MLENTKFRKPDLFPSSGEGRETPTLLGLLETPHHRIKFSSKIFCNVCTFLRQIFRFYIRDKLLFHTFMGYRMFNPKAKLNFVA
jgi:hypothetical protein